MKLLDILLNRQSETRPTSSSTDRLERELEAFQESKSKLARYLEPTGFPLGDSLTGRRVEDTPWTRTKLPRQ